MGLVIATATVEVLPGVVQNEHSEHVQFVRLAMRCSTRGNMGCAF